MIKPILIVAALSAASIVHAQAAPSRPACPAGTVHAAVRHSVIAPGKWATFEKAVADHQAWYVAHGNGTTTGIVRMLAPRGSAAPLTDSDAMTITRYDEPQPPHDASWDAFVAEYKASSTIKDEMQVCMPATAR